MAYRWVEHTAELELEIDARDREGVFADALHAMAELLADEGSGDCVSREVSVAGGEPGALLVGWLDELAYLAETGDLIPEELERIELSDGRLTASVRCRVRRLRHLVKAATYHRLAFKQSDGPLRARVVLDV
jgi:protein archease